eukprot:2717259-Rhodomonas_salina.1
MVLDATEVPVPHFLQPGTCQYWSLMSTAFIQTHGRITPKKWETGDAHMQRLALKVQLAANQKGTKEAASFATSAAGSIVVTGCCCKGCRYFSEERIVTLAYCPGGGASFACCEGGGYSGARSPSVSMPGGSSSGLVALSRHVSPGYGTWAKRGAHLIHQSRQKRNPRR